MYKKVLKFVSNRKKYVLNMSWAKESEMVLAHYSPNCNTLIYYSVLFYWIYVNKLRISFFSILANLDWYRGKWTVFYFAFSRIDLKSLQSLKIVSIILVASLNIVFIVKQLI